MGGPGTVGRVVAAAAAAWAVAAPGNVAAVASCMVGGSPAWIAAPTALSSADVSGASQPPGPVSV
eukprot:8939210-Pyramimonas_sp.AAC.1